MEVRYFIEINDPAIDYHETWELNSIGRIRTPGKFLFEHPYIPYLFACVQMGLSDPAYDGQLRLDAERVEVGDDMRKIWPRLQNAAYVHMFEAEDGFVYSFLEYKDGTFEKHHKVQRKDWEQ